MLAPLLPAVKPQLAEFSRQTVPPSSGNNMFLLLVGVVKPTVVVLPLPVLVAVMVLVSVPCKVNCWLVAPTVKLPLGVMVRVPALCSNGVVTLAVKVGLLTVLRDPQAPPDPIAIELPPPLKLPVPLGQVITILPCAAVFGKLP